jgi:hypothetical protein
MYHKWCLVAVQRRTEQLVQMLLQYFAANTVIVYDQKVPRHPRPWGNLSEKQESFYGLLVVYR